MLLSTLTTEPVIEGVRGDRRRQRAEVIRRRARDGGELTEAPVCECGGTTRCLKCEVIVRERLGPDVAGLDGALLGAVATCASRLVESVNAGVALIGWARGPFSVSGVRRDSGYTYPGHVSAPFYVPWGDEMESSSTLVNVEGWPGRPQRKMSRD
jgi:hypothetical protein